MEYVLGPSCNIPIPSLRCMLLTLNWFPHFKKSAIPGLSNLLHLIRMLALKKLIQPPYVGLKTAEDME
jgi:hypothetical protein